MEKIDIMIGNENEVPASALATGLNIKQGEILHVFINDKHAYELTYDDFLNLATRKAIIHTQADKKCPNKT